MYQMLLKQLKQCPEEIVALDTYINKQRIWKISKFNIQCKELGKKHKRVNLKNAERTNQYK